MRRQLGAQQLLVVFPHDFSACRTTDAASTDLLVHFLLADGVSLAMKISDTTRSRRPPSPGERCVDPLVCRGLLAVYAPA